jgi:hypothetical protein
MGDLSLPVQQADSGNAVAMASVAMMMDPTKLQALVTFAELMSKSSVTVPKHFQGKPADCLAICMQSTQWGMNPFAVAQKTHVTQGGALGYEAQLINAAVIGSGRLVGRPDFEFIGDWNKILGRVEERKSDSGGKYYVAAWPKADENGLGVIVSALIAGEAEPRKVQIMMSQAYPRFSTQWATDPQQQITYLAVRKFARRYLPEVILGVYTKDELMDADEPLPAGTRHMGAVDEVQQRPQTVAELPMYEATKFEQNFTSWSNKIASGDKTAQQLIDWIQSKARLTEGQIKRLRAVAVAEVVDAGTGEITKGQPTQGAQTTQTQASAQAADDTEAHPLEVAMNKAANRDALDLLADRIASEAGSQDWADYLKSVYHTNVERLDR